ncbi:MAG: rhodanese-like domain-containing protein [Betaproteobacteria bacterium]
MLRLISTAACAAVLLLAASGRARAQYAAPDGAPRITQQQFKTLIAKKNVMIVDTRNEEVYRLGHIPGAVLLPLEGLQIWPSEYGPVVERLKQEARPIVTYCA